MSHFTPSFFVMNAFVPAPTLTNRFFTRHTHPQIHARPATIRCQESETAPSSIPSSTTPTSRRGNDPITLVEKMPAPWLKMPWKQPKRTRQYHFDNTSGNHTFSSAEEASISSEQSSNEPQRVSDILAQLAGPLLPTGWPSSVARNYARWAFWHVGRHITRNAYYVIGTTSLLLALGLDTKKALAVSATLKWVLKDGLAMGTKLLVSTNLARIVDAAPKRCRFLGDSLMALSVAVEIMSLTNPSYFLVYGSLAALLKDAGGAMSGPAYRVFLDSFAIADNIGDVSSRGEAQVVIGNLIGLGVGVAATSALNSLPSDGRLLPTFCCYAVLAISHLTCTTNAVSTVQLRTLNAQRLDAVATAFESQGVVPDVATVNTKERFIRSWTPSHAADRVIIGASLTRFTATDYFLSLALERSADRFTVAYADGFAGVMLREDATVTDTLQGVLQARRLITQIDSMSSDSSKSISGKEVERITSESYDWASEKTPAFVRALQEKGWTTSKLLVGSKGFRYYIQNGK